MDRDRLWFKSCQGPARDGVGFSEMSRDRSFCAYAVLSDGPVVFEDTRLDPRLADHPLVYGGPNVRFYAGAPLLDPEGHALGALCLLDFQPRVFSADQRAALADLAASVVSEMELRRGVAALAESERLYRQMFLDSPHPMWIFDRETLRFLAVNETAVAHYGYTRAEFLAMTLADIRPSEDVPALHEVRCGSGLQPGDKSVWRHRKKNGALIWVEIAAHTVDYEGRAARMVIASDVTERKQAEGSLRRSLTMMKAQQGAAPDGILVVDEHRRIISYNQRLCEMWYVPDEVRRSDNDDGLLGHVLSLVKHPDEFLRRVHSLYEHPSERSREEIELADGRVFDRYSGPMVSEEGHYYGRIWFFRDISERRCMEQVLRRSEQKRALHIQNTPLAAIEWGLDFEVTAWNPAAERIFGYTQAEALGRRGPDLILPDAEQAPVDAIRVALLSGTGGTRSTNLNRTKDGREILCEWYNTPLVDDDGRVIGVAALAQDVTEEARGEAALRESEGKYRLLAEGMEDVVSLHDPEGNLLYVSPSVVKLTGYTPKEALAAETLSDIHPDDRAKLRAEGGPQSGRSALFEVRRRRKDGSYVWVEVQGSPLPDVQGRPAGFVSVMRDISGRREAEEGYRSLFANSMQGIYRTSPEGRALAVNAAAAHMLGHDTAEAACAFYTDLARQLYVNPGRRAEFAAQMREQGSVTDFEAEFRRKDGGVITVQMNARAILGADGAVRFYEGFMVDITERITLEAEREELLSQTEELLADALERADHDPLTGLINHRAFHKRLEEQSEAARREDRPLSLLLVDLNDFKFFNDAYGHLAGDDVLRRVASALLTAQRAGDTLARFGGDEFALLMPGATEAEAAQAAEALRAAVARVGYRPPGHDAAIPLSLSVGAASAPQDGAGRVALLGAADARLRVAQSGGDDEGQAMRLRRGMTRSVEGFSMLDALVTAVDNKDRYTRRHSEDVMAYSVRIARALGLDARTQHVVEVAALLHDVGKIGVPDAILRKPGRLTEEEFAAVKQHPMMGSVIVGAVPGFEATLDAVRHHHERWDGEGYPFGLRGEEIPLAARLMAVADAYSAMTTDRPYRKGMELTKARLLLEEGAGTQWDPACVAAFLGESG